MRFSVFSVVDHHPAGGRSVAEFYRETLARAELAERLGFEAYFLAEHHFHEYGVVPDPAVILSAIAQRTTRLRLGTAISVLPFRHPLNVAESYAMLDVLSGGRVVLGVGSGYLAHEFAGLGIDAAEKRERFDESLAVLKQALGGERVTFHGKFIRLEGVAINVRPVQRPTPPIYVAVLRKDGAFHVGRQGNNLMSVPYVSVERFAEVGEIAAEYARGRAESGQPGGDALYAFHTHVADSRDACRREAAAAFDLYVATRLYAKRQTYDDVMASGLALFGTVEDVAEKLVELWRMGVRHVLTLSDFGLMPALAVERSMRLFAEGVMPLVRRKIAAGAPA